jgi:hypothetical protein
LDNKVDNKRRSKMEDDFTKKRKKEIKECRNEVFLESIIYIVAVVLIFVHGGMVAELAATSVPKISWHDNIVKIFSFVYFLFLTAIVFIPGPLILITDIRKYFILRNSLWDY